MLKIGVCGCASSSSCMFVPLFLWPLIIFLCSKLNDGVMSSNGFLVLCVAACLLVSEMEIDYHGMYLEFRLLHSNVKRAVLID